ncbi:NUDIX hydrolase [Winogradskyella sp. A2]|uniref:NUDIX hydrolase n=1 Tax=Winogradskyella sp. A2 TaxID=3366944 RepID=UPI00398C5BA9
MVFNSFLDAVVKIKHLELFGEISHAKMSPPYRQELAKRMQANAKSAKKAGVLALFYPNADFETNFVLILRKTYEGVHSAQVGFPGGKFEEGDNNLMTTAKRETEEEVGVPISKLNIIKPMSPLYIPPSNFLVHPFLAVAQDIPRFKKQEDEVEDIIEVALIDFLNEKNTLTTRVPTSYNVEVEVPAFKLNDHIVWGATAMMLSELKDLLKQVL